MSVVTRKPKIAIVDDEPPISEMLGELLEDAGFEPIIAPHGPRAYSYIRDSRPDLILLDVLME